MKRLQAIDDRSGIRTEFLGILWIFTSDFLAHIELLDVGVKHAGHSLQRFLLLRITLANS